MDGVYAGGFILIIDFRYHLASLISVFLALGLGILIGGAVLGNPALQKELSSIEENLAKLRNDQRQLEEEIARRDADLKVCNQFESAALPALVRNKLLGKRVALVRTNTAEDVRLVRSLAKLFQTAGAKVTSTSTILRDPAELAPEKLAEIGRKLNLSTAGAAEVAPALLKLAADRIANGPVYGGSSKDNLLETLSAARLIELSGDYGGMVDVLVLLGGGSDPAKDRSKVDGLLIDAVVGAKGLIVAATETSTTPHSYLEEYLKHPIIVVDNVETIPGQTALILALMRGRKGHYGIKGAHQLVPELI